MVLANYINDLLYRYDCVIIPDFGGFVANRVSAKVNHFTHTFYPPTKQITFNSHLKHNDGLLVNYIASLENNSFEKASNMVSSAVVKLKNQLQSSGVVEIKNLGKLSLNKEEKIIFEPLTSVNYLTESFGLSTVSSSAIKRIVEVKPLVAPVQKEDRKGIPAFIKYAAAAAIALTLGFGGYQEYQKDKQEQVLATQQSQLEKKIQEATFVISNPLPTVKLNVVKEVEAKKPFHIVAGAFRFPENADKKVSELQAQGYDAQIVGVNKWGLTQVTYNSFETRAEAVSNLELIRQSASKEAWILVKDLD